MTKWIQTVPVLFLIQCLHGVPVFKGISFKQDFDFSLKPLEFKPFKIIKEKWSPFGVFGKKHVIEKRQVPGAAITELNGALPNIGKEAPKAGDIPMAVFTKRVVPVLPPPVFEKTDPLPPPPLYVKPKVKYIIEVPDDGPPVSEPIPPPSPIPIEPVAVEATPVPAPPLPNVPLIVPPELAKMGYGTYIIKKEMELPPPPPVPAVPETPPIPPLPPVPAIPKTPPIPPLPALPVPVSPETPPIPPLPPVPVPLEIPPAPVGSPGPPELSQRLLTDVTGKDPAENVIPNAEPPKPKDVPLETSGIPDKPRVESTFVKASKLALTFSQMFVQLMNQFFTSARATIDQISSPPPVFKP